MFKKKQLEGPWTLGMGHLRTYPHNFDNILRNKNVSKSDSIYSSYCGDDAQTDFLLLMIWHLYVTTKVSPCSGIQTRRVTKSRDPRTSYGSKKQGSCFLKTN